MKNTADNTNPTVVAVDIGTTKVCAIAGRKNEYDKIEILGVGTVTSEGVARGVVNNIEKSSKAINEARGIAERNSGLSFNDIHVGIAGQHIASLHQRGLLVRKDVNTEISEEDVDKLINDMHRLVLPAGDKILHVIPQEFSVDDEQNIMDPIGMSGVRKIS